MSMSRKQFSNLSEGRNRFERKRKNPDNSAVREVRETAAVRKGTWNRRRISVGRTKGATVCKQVEVEGKGRFEGV